jgi:hypothetical protein
LAKSEDFNTQIDLVDALLDRQTEKLIALRERHAVAFAPFERLANKKTLTKAEQRQYTAAKQAVQQIVERINRVRERERQLRAMRRLLRLALRVARMLEAGAPDPDNRPLPASDADVTRTIQRLGDLPEVVLLPAVRGALHPAKVSRDRFRQARAAAFGPPRRGRRMTRR